MANDTPRGVGSDACTFLTVVVDMDKGELKGNDSSWWWSCNFNGDKLVATTVLFLKEGDVGWMFLLHGSISVDKVVSRDARVVESTATCGKNDNESADDNSSFSSSFNSGCSKESLCGMVVVATINSAGLSGSVRDAGSFEDNNPGIRE